MRSFASLRMTGHDAQKYRDPLLLQRASQLVKKVPDGLFDCASAAEHFVRRQNAISQKLEKINLLGRRLIVLEAGLAPSSSPAALFSNAIADIL